MQPCILSSPNSYYVVCMFCKVEQPSSTLGGKLNCENDGSKFFEAMSVVGTEALALSAEDVSGGLQSMSTVN